LPIDDRQDERSPLRSSPTGPWVTPPRAAAGQPPAVKPNAVRKSRRPMWSMIFFAILVASVGIRAYRDLSRPEAWTYWRESYLSPSMTSSLIAKADLNGAGRGKTALAISGKIGVATASWLRERLDEAHLAPGDIVLLSSPGGDLAQAIIMGEIIRSRGLATAVGLVNASGRIEQSFCASACVLAYAGGQPRYGVEGSALGVHRFVTSTPGRDPVAETQRTAGMVLSYLTRMGVSSSVVEAMSETRNVRWLAPKEASAMNLVTDPLRKP
jgi:hypothetical protein